MAEGSNKRRKKGNITQEHIFSLLQRYSVTTVLTLLKEVAQVADIKIDWNELVKKTATGISSAREYQMLWRHLAYRDILEEKLDESAVPMDNDSDLEFELEAHPPVSCDASSEAAACVKVMIASASLIDVNLSSVVEAPLSVNIPSGWSSSAASENPQLQETNITVPVLVPKQPLSLSTVASVEILDANEIAGGPSRRKRKPWSKKEDAELLAAVQRNGEGNWANILKGDFKSDRTASQLSQRWAIIKKRKENSSAGAGSQLVDFHALRRAFHHALDMPIVDKPKSNFMNGRGVANPNTITTPSNSTRPISGEPSQPGTHSQHHLRQDSDHMTSSKTRFINSMKTSTSPALSPDAMVKAAAVAAGARIATPSDAATLLKAAHSKNAVHIIPSGGNSIKTSGPSNMNSLPPNVHYIRTGLVNRSISGHNNVIRPGGTHHAQSQVTRPSVPTVLTNPPQTANGSDLPKEKVCEEVIVVSGISREELVQTSVASVSCNEAKDYIQGQALHNEADEQAKKESVLPGLETHDARMPPPSFFFQAFGIPDMNIGKMLLLNPRIISYSIELKLSQIVDFLARLGMNEEGMIGKVLVKNPFIMGYSVEKRLNPTLEFLKSVGLSELDLRKVAINFPEVLCRDVDKILRPKFEYLKQCGFVSGQVAALVSGYPPILIKSINNSLEPRIKFLLEVMGRKIEEVVEYPDFFRHGLKKKLEFRQKLLNKNNVHCSLSEMLELNQKKFLLKYSVIEEFA